MSFLSFWKREQRASPENPKVPVSAENFLQYFGLGGITSGGDVVVTTDSALTVPAVWCAVNFLAGTLAGLPLHVYKKSKDGEGRDRVKGGLANILHDAVNDELSSFDWRKQLFTQVLTGGRHFSFIERNARGQVINIWPLDPGAMTVVRKNGRKVYQYRDGARQLTYQASEILDIAFMLKDDGISHRGPITSCKKALGLAIVANDYGSRFFNNGGVPPFAVTGNFQGGGSMKRAASDLEKAVKDAVQEGRNALVLPSGLEIKSIGSDPEKSQFIETKRFSIEETARIYQLPPAFLQDLTNGTFSNTEQQDLHLTKHAVKRWVEQFEQELNLKLFGRSNRQRYVEMNMDGLLRGDFKTRMEGYSSGIQNGVLKPNEARRRENLPDEPDGEKLFIQGGTFPISQQSAQGDQETETDDGNT